MYISYVIRGCGKWCVRERGGMVNWDLHWYVPKWFPAAVFLEECAFSSVMDVFLVNKVIWFWQLARVGCHTSGLLVILIISEIRATDMFPRIIFALEPDQKIMYHYRDSRLLGEVSFTLFEHSQRQQISYRLCILIITYTIALPNALAPIEVIVNSYTAFALAIAPHSWYLSWACRK